MVRTFPVTHSSATSVTEQRSGEEEGGSEIERLQRRERARDGLEKAAQGKRRKSDESMTFLSALPLDVPLQKRSRDSLFGGVFTKENVPL